MAVLPPFRTARLGDRLGRHAAGGRTHARGLRAAAPAATGIMVLGPAEAPLALIRGRSPLPAAGARRTRQRHAGLCPAMLGQGPKARGSVQVQVDIDPQSFL
jgi:primosomal protein N' (replication factor Y)